MSVFKRILFWGAAALAAAALGAGPALAQDNILDLTTAGGSTWKLKQVPKDDKSALDQYNAATYVPDDTWVDQDVPGVLTLDPADDTSFYYRVEFEVPSTFPKNRPVILHGFQVDDRDETYLNGTLIGSGSVWNVERNYTIPEGALNATGKNVLLIFGTDDTGGEGINDTTMGGPILETISDTEGWLKIESLDASDRPVSAVPFTITEDVDGTPTDVDHTTDTSGTYWVRNLEPGTVTVKVTQYPWTGNLTPNGTLPQTIKAGELTTLVIRQQPFIYQVLKTDTAITIDGVREALWDKAITMEINDPRQVVDQPANWTDLADLSCRARWLYDDTYIYLFAEVTDDARNNIMVDQEDATSWGNSWQGDGFETYIQLDPYAAGRTTYTPDRDYQWTLGVNAEDKVSWKIFRATASPNDTTPFSDPLTIPRPDEGNAKVVSTTNPVGYILEARFKWADLPEVNAQLIPPKVGTGGAIGLAVNDSDDEGTQRQSQIMWNAQNDLWNNPSHFVRAVWAGTEPLNLSPPGIPTGVTATSTGPSVVLNWTAVPGATGYKIRRTSSTTANPITFIKNTGNVPVTTTTFEDKPVNVGTFYRYAVVATNLVGDSANSEVVAVTVGGGGGACTLGDVVGATAGEVDVSDAVALLQHIVGITSITDPNRLKAADADKSGGIDVGDAVKVLQVVVGLATKENCP